MENSSGIMVRSPRTAKLHGDKGVQICWFKLGNFLGDFALVPTFQSWLWDMELTLEE